MREYCRVYGQGKLLMRAKEESAVLYKRITAHKGSIRYQQASTNQRFGQKYIACQGHPETHFEKSDFENPNKE